MPEPIVVAADLRKRYGDRVAVDGVSFTVAAGEAYGLLGPNGAGKTTAISMVCGLLSRDGGTVTVAGRRMDGDAVEAKSFVGYVPQDLALYPDLSARENLDFWGKLYGLGGPQLRDRATKVLDIVGLSDRAKDRVSDFSGA
ncbi:MAG: ABC transporter ATP-binding protein [Chloroflexi bacterium]|nr:ABC transporter ATP-binding protein [Chloroflexota bacterium]